RPPRSARSMAACRTRSRVKGARGGAPGSACVAIGVHLQWDYNLQSKFLASVTNTLDKVATYAVYLRCKLTPYVAEGRVEHRHELPRYTQVRYGKKGRDHDLDEHSRKGRSFAVSPPPPDRLLRHGVRSLGSHRAGRRRYDGREYPGLGIALPPGHRGHDLR